ncbi:hypothetical protein GCK72_000092 [Caenorhabditis remanei]|uniref:Uncharacterized protein n=1 Tax=Caenorhabditis remanei TaxID=31234 RepID=A0A6A5HJC9_CAERE|nr:hypothetical protein GCK72_000092 [Caenorhabditis remanei]KAF1768280.1 hypothetical protein GCK72_000092 [Caenorhabditis remanei]
MVKTRSIENRVVYSTRRRISSTDASPSNRFVATTTSRFFFFLTTTGVELSLLFFFLETSGVGGGETSSGSMTSSTSTSSGDSGDSGASSESTSIVVSSFWRINVFFTVFTLAKSDVRGRDVTSLRAFRRYPLTIGINEYFALRQRDLNAVNAAERVVDGFRIPISMTRMISFRSTDNRLSTFDLSTLGAYPSDTASTSKRRHVRESYEVFEAENI